MDKSGNLIRASNVSIYVWLYPYCLMQIPVVDNHQGRSQTLKLLTPRPLTRATLGDKWHKLHPTPVQGSSPRDHPVSSQVVLKRAHMGPLIRHLLSPSCSRSRARLLLSLSHKDLILLTFWMNGKTGMASLMNCTPLWLLVSPNKYCQSRILAWVVCFVFQNCS